MDHGCAPATSKALYETEWFYATGFDIFEKPERFTLLKDDATEEAQQACIARLEKFIRKLDERWADGRAHVGGDHITHADFYLLSIITSHYENANGKHQKIRDAAGAMI